MSSVQYDVRKVCGRPEGVPQSGAIPYSGLDDVTIRGLALATLRHRKTPIRRRSVCLAINLFRSCCISATAAGYGRASPSIARRPHGASDPGGIEANLLGVDRFVEDVGNELVRGLLSSSS